MTGKELVNAYNTLAKANGLLPVQRFSTIAAGKRRLETLKKQIAMKTERAAELGAPEEEKFFPPAEKTEVSVKKAEISVKEDSAPVEQPSQRQYLSVAPEIKKMFPKNPSKFRPAMEGMLIRYKLVIANPTATRKEFITLCLQKGIKKSTAGRQWGIPMEKLTEKFKEVMN